MDTLDINQKLDVAYCIPLSLRDEQIKINLSKVKKRIEPESEKTEPIAIVCYGPSLKDNLEELRKFKVIMSCSGALKFLIDNGIIPTYHVDLDPREHKMTMLGTPQASTKYMLASTIHPKYIDKLDGFDVSLWHIFANDEEAQRILPKGEWAITGGSSVGLRCMTLSRFLGYKDLHIFGMDGSADSNGGSHTAKHPNAPSSFSEIEYGGKKYLTTGSMLFCAKETWKELDQMRDVKATFYGEGLVQAMAKDYKPNHSAHQTILGFNHPTLISDEYKELNHKLHMDNPSYGMGGIKYVDTVIKLYKSLITPENQFVKVLDYGCGKGTLAKNLPFSIDEYDPAIPGKDELPGPSDLVICTDVLEHIEPDKLNFVLDDLRRVTKNIGYFVISTRKAGKSYANGQNAHLIIQGKDWWSKKLKKFFTVATIQEKTETQELHVVVAPKKENENQSVIAAVEFEGKKVRFEVPNDNIRWRVDTIFTKEAITIEWIKSFKHGETMIDVGANMGGYSMLAASKGVKVIAFEPEAETYALLQRNTVLNGTNVTAYCAAITDRHKFDKLYLSQRGIGGSCHAFAQEQSNNIQGCIGLALDDLDIQADHIKIDVDGQEPKVIAGAIKMLKKGKVKSILIEVNTNVPEHMQMIKEIELLGFEFQQSQVDASIRKEGAFKGCSEFLFRKKEEKPIIPQPKKERAPKKKNAKGSDFIVQQIDHTDVVNRPFAHVYVKDVFPASFYKKMVDNFPDNYIEIEKSRGARGYPKRFTADLVGAPWEEVKKIMTDGKLKKMLLDKFNIVDEEFTEDVLLIRDKEQYQITPHTDLRSKVISALFYLPKKANVFNGGTYLYEPNQKGFTCNTGAHYKFEDFKSIMHFGLIPNTMLAFARTDDSFHGVEPTDNVRDVLLYNIRRKA